IQVGAAIGSTTAAAAAWFVSTMDQTAALSWGWRIPFLFSIVLVLVGIYIRVKLAESPIFAQAIAAKPPEEFPLMTALRKEPHAPLTVFLTCVTESAMLQMFTVFAITFIIGMKLPATLIINGVIWGNIVGVVMNPFWGWLSDYTGRRPLIAGSLI